MSIIEKTKALRIEAWDAVLDSPAYKAWKGLDDAVKAMTSEEPKVVPLPVVPNRAKTFVKMLPAKRVTQADVAAYVLKRHGEPLPIGRWLEKSVEAGIRAEGKDPLANFRSTASRDDRFYPLTRNNMYFWWLKGVELPEGWKEAADPDLPGLSAASDSDDREGGDGHAAMLA